MTHKCFRCDREHASWLYIDPETRTDLYPGHAYECGFCHGLLYIDNGSAIPPHERDPTTIPTSRHTTKEER